jgi:hypothetical protein
MHVRSNQNYAAINHPERLRRAYREVKNTASTEWTSIVDNNNYASTACRIGYSKARPERQGPMGGSKARATTRVIDAGPAFLFPLMHAWRKMQRQLRLMRQKLRD